MQFCNIIHNKGSVLTLFLLFFPVFLILAGLVIDGGRMFVSKAQMQSMIDSATNAGISVIGDEIVRRVEEKKAINPELVIPSNLASLLNDEERESIAELPEVLETVHAYLDANNYLNFFLEDIEVVYPYRYASDDYYIQLKILWDYEIPLYFSAFLPVSEVRIHSESLSSLPIR